MSEDTTNYLLDVEFKRYLQIMRPYIRQLEDQDMIDLCNSWIQRLSNCGSSSSEKNTRNKYVFTMCYQLARGLLSKPFLGPPPEFDLPVLVDEFGSESSSEVNFIVISPDCQNTKTLFNSKKAILSDTDLDTQYVDDDDEKKDNIGNTTRSVTSGDSSGKRENFLCRYVSPNISKNKNDENNYKQSTNKIEDEYEYRSRTTNLVMRLREIKKQNFLLNKELQVLKEESKKPLSGRTDEDCYEGHSLKLDIATSPQFVAHSDTDQIFEQLAQEKEKNNFLIGKIEGLQEQLNYYNDIRRQDMKEIVAKHKQEIIKIKKNISEECKKKEDDHVKQIEQENETKVLRLKCAHEQEVKLLKKNFETKLGDLENLVENKEKEITYLKSMMVATEQGVNLKTLLEKLLERPNESMGVESEKSKARELQKQLTKMEKAKAKCIKIYENKIACLEREKQMSECSLHLQLARHRVKVVNEISDENQIELNTALNSLEAKYKEIIANVQATAIQRRMQDQKALEAILQAACSMHPSRIFQKRPLSTNFMHAKDFARDQRGYDTDVSELLHHEMNSKNAVNNHTSKAYETEPSTTGYCLDGEKFGELFQKVYIPQRDTESVNKMH